jgi:hypothetical protein
MSLDTAAAASFASQNGTKTMLLLLLLLLLLQPSRHGQNPVVHEGINCPFLFLTPLFCNILAAANAIIFLIVSSSSSLFRIAI